jgi:hypothetical protein
MNTTEWFPGDVKPVRNGVYERDFGDSGDRRPRFCKFENGEWYSFGETVELAAASKFTVPNHLMDWRGLSEKAA